MTTQLEQAARQALEALNRSDYLGWQVNIPIIKALRAALEQPAQQEPVAWMYTSQYKGDERFITRYQSELTTYKADKVWPLYTRPQAREPLTDEQICRIGAQVHGFLLCNEGQWGIEMARAIEAAHGIRGEA